MTDLMQKNQQIIGVRGRGENSKHTLKQNTAIKHSQNKPTYSHRSH